MKTVSVREVQHNLAGVLARVARGEEVAVTRRNRVVARLLPPEPRSDATPDFVARAQAIWGPIPDGEAMSALLAESRGKQ